uniref:Mitochondrial import receptor subunit TOM34 n=1 Tax=Lygus hesperus TaxID=30085 RepID=A0A0A9Y508_LYGHE
MSNGRQYYNDALSKYTEALMRDAENMRALYSRAELNSLLKRHDDALHDLNTLLRLSPSHAEALRLRISLNAQQGQLYSAAQDADRLVTIYKTNKHSAKAKEMQNSAEKLHNYAKR